ncbi:hypothetical protein LUZ60_003820 [Juncus effusus]|nr:hypothetical protein LUZ60_003820 [Juncus effusus]
MASNPSSEELSFRMNELLYDNFYEERNDLNSYKLNESQPSNHNEEFGHLTSNASLNYVSQMLLEEIDENTIFDQEEAAIRATEKIFYDIIGQEYPSSSDKNTQNQTGLNNSNSGDCSCKQSMDSLVDSQFQKGVQEAMKFLPSVDKLSINLDKFNESKSKMNTDNRNADLVGENKCKKAAFYAEEPLRNDFFDKVLLGRKEDYLEEVSNLRAIMQKEITSELEENNEKSIIDLRPLLINCAHAISNNDHIISNELIKRIRENSSPNGNWYQRLAHYFLYALEARLAGTGSEIYRKLVSIQPTTTNHLKAFRIYLAACPYTKASFYFSNKTILNMSKNASKIHIFDFGINHGFQWPSFLERISSWGKKPKIKITGIDFPLPGFRPAQQVEEAGKRLSDYAKSFNIDFHYQGIACKWENIKIDDLNVEKDEIIIVNCLFRSRLLIDESNLIDRDSVLKTISELKPNIFIHGIINGMSNSPYFVTRFRETLFYYSSFFDMIDANMPRNSEERFAMERYLLGPKVVNIIACEGSERVVRPENYRQWQTRSIREGYVQNLLDREIYNNIIYYVRKIFHKEYVVDEDNNWLLMGWKGRIAFALSTWKPNQL